ncbi:type VII secretion-associated serine protease mycosin [Streptomyces sp. NPDC020965]|uniref:type VII secretion-associated serine protease mycosin n=1 Tax=Streptomyces sp. NPDC020965 TaxID=3365105 RepID=UPI00378C05E1
MPTSSTPHNHRRNVVSGVLGLLLVGIAATPAHANTVRSDQWHLDAMKADEMWRIGKGAGITVALIDSGVDDTLPDLKGQVLKGKDYSQMDGDENNDIADHGTGMATLIAGTGARGLKTGSWGLAPGVKILPIRMPYEEERFGQDARTAYSQKMSEAIRYAADSSARIINISMGRAGVGSTELTQAVRYALSKNKLIFAAVGNTAHTGNEPEHPAATPGVVGVGGVDKSIKWWKKSQSGPQVDFAAPAVEAISACSPTKLCEGEGTSAAAALASASAALVWSKHPEWTNNQVLRVMLNTAGGPHSGEKRTDFIGYGVVRPRVALKTPGDPGPADVYPLPDLAAAAPKSPAPQASQPASGDKADGQADSAAPAAAKDDGEDSGLWIGLGVGAAVLLGAAVAVPIVRVRRRAAAAPAPDPAAFSPQQPYGPPPYPGYGPPPTGPNGPTGGTPGPHGYGQDPR